MARLVDGFSIALLLLAAAALLLGLRAFAARDDLSALFALLVGALSLKASVDLIRPRGA